MDEQVGRGGAGSAAPRGGRTAAFVGLLGLYYAAYYFLFAQRLSEYFRDLVSHFAFFRRLF